VSSLICLKGMTLSSGPSLKRAPFPWSEHFGVQLQAQGSRPTWIRRTNFWNFGTCA
jgi:hypothetical protein